MAQAVNGHRGAVTRMRTERSSNRGDALRTNVIQGCHSDRVPKRPAACPQQLKEAQMLLWIVGAFMQQTAKAVAANASAAQY
ncbi:hypothetical protein OM076_10790 [Solirubrobacter ginsenosidimutans]|uniref:Uncharacterized protein n=1 Tax=Solirubrobacter ginsenosidimutans TaxID=490573 RepID=A0A9X3MQZ0_9ACTN|nr:hypothetical protein [Solirubrobacter ginsenosidimutans]